MLGREFDVKPHLELQGQLGCCNCAGRHRLQDLGHGSLQLSPAIESAAAVRFNILRVETAFNFPNFIINPRQRRPCGFQQSGRTVNCTLTLDYLACSASSGLGEGLQIKGVSFSL
jgi:hypothetical protein